MRTRWLCRALPLAVLLSLPYEGVSAADVTVIDGAESPRRFRRGRPTADAKVGSGAVVFDLPAGKTAFYALFIEDAAIDLSKYAGLAFWWKVEGEGLRSLAVKTRFPTMFDGRQLVFPVWRRDRGSVPTEWASALISFSDRGGMQGEPSDMRVIEFRTYTTDDSKVRLFIDHVVALAATFRLRVAASRQEDGNWVAPVAVTNDGRDEVEVDYGTGSLSKGTLTIGPGQTVESSIPLPVDGKAFRDLRPLESQDTDVWAQIRGVELTRTMRVVRVIKPVPLPPRPRLLVDATQVAEIQERIRKHEWARARWEKEKKAAAAALKREVELPPRGGVSAHYYANPKTGGRLRAGKKVGPWEWEHVDRKTGEVFRGDPSAHETDYDGVKIGYVHSGWAKDAQTLGLVYQVTGEEQYAAKAREILLAYASKYLSYPRTRHGNPKTHGIGRATAHYLTESVWVIAMAQAADLVWDHLSEAERRLLADKLFYPALRDSIDPVRCYVHNIQCWKNSALGLVGLLYGDLELVHKALHDGEEGYWQQIEQGILPGGVWYEGSWGYHFYTMSAMVPLTEACRHCDVDLYADRLKEMYLAPIRLAMPDSRLPSFNDSGILDFAKMGHRYELAAARWDDPVFRTRLSGTRRISRAALLHGIDAPDGKPNSTIRSANHEGAGYAILARGEGRDATWLCLKYCPPSKYHGHPDRLGFILYARGRVVAPDPGCLSYGLPLHRGWYKTTLAHSTLMVDGVSQEERQSKCLGFGAERGVDYAVLDDGDAIPGLRFVRTAAIIDKDLILFIDQVRSDRERLLDFAYHQDGTWANLPAGERWTPPDEPPYRYLKSTTTRDASHGLTVTTRLDENWQVAVTVGGGEPTQALTGTGPGLGGAHVQVPCLILRRLARETALAWAIALDGRAPRLEWVDSGRPRSEVATVRVTAPGRPPLILTVSTEQSVRRLTIAR